MGCAGDAGGSEDLPLGSIRHVEEPCGGRARGPDQVRQQGDRVPGLDKPDVDLEVRRLVPDVRLEAG